MSSRGTSIEADTDLGKYQALERPEWMQVGGSKPYRMHLKNQGKAFGHDKKLANDENNMLAGSWQFHQFLDGLNMPGKMPIIAVQPAEIKEEVVVEQGHKRRKVMVDIECRDVNTSGVISTMLKPGFIKKSNLVFSTQVLVKDHKTFTEYLQWKYDDTKTKWEEMQKLVDEE